MRVGHVSGQRNAPIDRNSGSKTIAYGLSGDPPAAPTIVAQYTVPTGKRAQITEAFVHARRDTPPTTPGLFLVEVTFNAVNVLLEVSSRSNAIDGGSEHATGMQQLLVAGNTCELTTSDASVGGTVRNALAATIIEYDA